MSDIVTRLRAVLHNDRSVELMNREAADEIERLRKELETLHQRIKDIKEGFEGCCNACEPVGEMNKQLRQQRDEARKPLSARDAQKFLAMLDAPGVPNAALKAAAECAMDKIAELDEEMGL